MKRVVFRSGAFCSSKFQFSEHLEWDENFAWRMLEKLLPHMVGTPTKAGDKDISIDEVNHLRCGIKGFHWDRKRANLCIE